MSCACKSIHHRDHGGTQRKPSMFFCVLSGEEFLPDQIRHTGDYRKPKSSCHDHLSLTMQGASSNVTKFGPLNLWEGVAT